MTAHFRHITALLSLCLLAAPALAEPDLSELTNYRAYSPMLSSSGQPSAEQLKAVRDAGLEVPRDVSIVGFDDVPEASLVMPSLTTVRQPLMEMGATAVRLLQRLMDEPGATPRRTELDTELVVRGSTAPPRGHRRRVSRARVPATPARAG